MKMKGKLHTGGRMVTSVFMMVTLLWLTISIPFVTASQQQIAKQNSIATKSLGNATEEESNPLSNTSEEKSSSSNSISEEYLHDFHTLDQFILIASETYASHHADVYVAYHGELLVPPPNIG
jgi:hypothetical protein